MESDGEDRGGETYFSVGDPAKVQGVGWHWLHLVKFRWDVDIERWWKYCKLSSEHECKYCRYVQSWGMVGSSKWRSVKFEHRMGNAYHNHVQSTYPLFDTVGQMSFLLWLLFYLAIIYSRFC